MPFLTSVAVGWLALYGVVRILDNRSGRRLSAFLLERNVSIYPIGLTVSTNRFNSRLENIAKRHRGWLSHWFGLGVVFGFFGLVASVIILTLTVFNLSIPHPPVSWSEAAQREISELDHQLGATLWAARGKRWKESGERKLRKVREKWSRRRVKKRANLRGFHQRAQEEQQRLLAEADGSTQSINDSDEKATIGNENDIHHNSNGRTRSESEDKTRPRIPHVSRFVVEHMSSSSRSSESLPLKIDTVTRPVMKPNNEGMRETKPHESERRDAPPRTLKDNSSTVRELKLDAGTAPTAEKKRNPQEGNRVLTLLLPGVTIPAFHVIYLAIAVLIAAAVHELGHALAAAAYDAQVARVGGFFALVFPGAFVQLEGVEKLLPFAQLKVWCAGAWHNFVSAVAALAILAALPHILGIFFSTRSGAIIVNVPRSEYGLDHYLRPGDIITHFGPYEVVDGGDGFRSAVARLGESKYSTGFCVSGDLYKKISRHESRCCDGRGGQIDLQCFYVAEKAHRRTCMDPHVVAHQQRCQESTECKHHFAPPPGYGRRRLMAAVPYPTQDEEPATQPLERQLCYRAKLPDDQSVVDIHFRNVRSGLRSVVMFEGHPTVLAHALTVSSYVPRLWALTPQSIVRTTARLDIANHLQRLLQYFVSVSLAIALVNLAPVYRLDGEETALLFIRVAAPKMGAVRVKQLRTVLIQTGTLLLIVNLLVAYMQFRR